MAQWTDAELEAMFETKCTTTISVSAKDIEERFQWATRNKWLWRAVLVPLVPMQLVAGMLRAAPEFAAEARGLWHLRDIGHWHKPEA